jgi:hypothetical protein
VRLKDLKDDQSGVTWNDGITQGYVELRLMCHVSPIFIRFTDPTWPLKRDMCHPL